MDKQSMVNATSVGRRLRQLRLAGKISQRALAATVGISGASLSNMEKGRTLPRHENLYSLAQALGVTTDYLLTGDGMGEAPVAKLTPDEADLLNHYRLMPQYQRATLAALATSFYIANRDRLAPAEAAAAAPEVVPERLGR